MGKLHWLPEREAAARDFVTKVCIRKHNPDALASQPSGPDSESLADTAARNRPTGRRDYATSFPWPSLNHCSVNPTQLGAMGKPVEVTKFSEGIPTGVVVSKTPFELPAIPASVVVGIVIELALLNTQGLVEPGVIKQSGVESG